MLDRCCGTAPPRDGVHKREPALAPPSMGAPAERDPAGGQHGCCPGRRAQRDPVDPSSHHPALANLSPVQPNRAETPRQHRRLREPWHVPAWLSAGWQGNQHHNPLLPVPYFDTFLKKTQQKEKKTEKSGKKGKNGLRDIQGIFLCGHTEFL